MLFASSAGITASWRTLQNSAILARSLSRQRLFAAADQHVGLDAERGQFAHAMLGRLGLQLAGGGDVGHQRDVDRTRVAAAEIVPQLADRLDERQRFDVADGAADLAQHEIEIVGLGQRERLDRVGDVRDHLHGRAEIVAAPLAL